MSCGPAGRWSLYGVAGVLDARCEVKGGVDGVVMLRYAATHVPGCSTRAVGLPERWVGSRGVVSWPGWVSGVVVFPIVWGRVRVCEAASRGFPDCQRKPLIMCWVVCRGLSWLRRGIDLVGRIHVVVRMWL